jgi:hypothetical protein
MADVSVPGKGGGGSSASGNGSNSNTIVLLWQTKLFYVVLFLFAVALLLYGLRVCWRGLSRYYRNVQFHGMRAAYLRDLPPRTPQRIPTLYDRRH